MGQHRGLGTAGGARGEEKPAGIVILDRGILDINAGMRLDRIPHRAFAEHTLLADPPGEVGTFDRLGMIREIAVTQKRFCAGRARKIGDFIRHQPKIGRHPHRAQPERGKHRPEHLVAILGMNEDAVALCDAARGKRCRKRRDQGIDLAPGPGFFAPDESRAIAVPPRILRDEIAEVHHPARHPQQPARRRHGGGGLLAHRRPIHIPAAISTTPTTPETMPCLVCTRVTPVSCPGKKPGN
jgi:hypothetical protein